MAHNMAPNKALDKAGPSISESIEEVQGIFPSDATLQEALSQLTLAGFDRAEFSLPETAPAPGHATPNQSADDPNTDVDNRQIRNMTTGMAGTIGAFAAAGATIATGGAAALAAGAAVAAGLGAGAVAHATNTGAAEAQHQDRDARARRGQLVLAVHATDIMKQAQAGDILRRAGATRVETVRREGMELHEISAAGWTG